MTHRDAYREHAPRQAGTPWPRFIGEASTPPAEIMAMRRAAYQAKRFYTFTEEELAKLPAFSRAAIQSAAKEILG